MAFGGQPGMDFGKLKKSWKRALWQLLLCVCLCGLSLAGIAHAETGTATAARSGVASAAAQAARQADVQADKVLRIAFCHLALSQGPKQQNLEKLHAAIQAAGEHGADWVITPETAVQGYYFYVVDPAQKRMLTVQPSEETQALADVAAKYGAYLFLGTGEYDPEADCYRNACLVFGPDGRLIGRHRKLSAHKGIRAEAWSTNGYALVPIDCGGVSVGPLVCSDIWTPVFPRVLADKGVQVLVDIAAWPPDEITGNPLPDWELVSRRTGLPVFVCNQTGNTPWMDMTVGQSTVVEGGQAKLLHSGEEAVLLFDWNAETGQVASADFTRIPLRSIWTAGSGLVANN